MMSYTPTPQWLETSVIEGLQTLLTLRLRNAPAADTVDALVDVWLAAFMSRSMIWVQDVDEPRLQTAFMRVAGRVESWPAPVNVLDAMPILPVKPSLPPPIPKTKPEVVSKHMAAMRALLSSWTVPKPKPVNRTELNQQIQQKMKESP